MAIDLRDGVDFMDVLQVIKNRRSIHTFQPQEVPDDILIDIFSYASYAPTHYMKEPWNIKMYQGEGRHKLIDESMASYKRLGMFETGSEVKTEKMIASMKDFLLDIPHHALIYMPIEEDPVRYEEEYAAVCAFIQNAQLAAWIFGVGMLWTRSEEHTSELQSRGHLVCRLLLEKKNIEIVENDEQQSLIRPVERPINAYNKALSEKSNDVEYLSDPYMQISRTELHTETQHSSRH